MNLHTKGRAARSESMGHPALSKQMRTRITIVIVASVVLFLLMLPLTVIAITRGDYGMTAGLLAIGLGPGVVFGAMMWWQVRRWRNDPVERRREPKPAAFRILIFGNMAVFVIGDVTRRLVAHPAWLTWVVAGSIFIVGSVVVFYFAKRQDPRLHYFRRPDPLPENEANPDVDVSPRRVIG